LSADDGTNFYAGIRFTALHWWLLKWSTDDCWALIEQLASVPRYTKLPIDSTESVILTACIWPVATTLNSFKLTASYDSEYNGSLGVKWHCRVEKCEELPTTDLGKYKDASDMQHWWLERGIAGEDRVPLVL